MVYIQKYIATEFLDRSIKNRNIINKLIQENKPETNYYEVTDKINTLFGFVLFPAENFDSIGKETKKYILKNIKGDIVVRFKEFFKKLQNDNRYGCKNAQNIRNNIDSWTTESVWEIIKCIRHSLAHSGKNGITFLPFEEGLPDLKSIESVVFYSFYKDEKATKQRKFVIEIMVASDGEEESELDILIKLIIRFLRELSDEMENDEIVRKQKNNKNEAIKFLNKIKNKKR